ncbi:hypothetical protein [Nostoc sp.]
MSLKRQMLQMTIAGTAPRARFLSSQRLSQSLFRGDGFHLSLKTSII